MTQPSRAGPLYTKGQDIVKDCIKGDTIDLAKLVQDIDKAIDEKPARPSEEYADATYSLWIKNMNRVESSHSKADFKAGLRAAIAYQDERLAIAVEALKGIAGVHGETTEHGWKMRVDQEQAREALRKIEGAK